MKSPAWLFLPLLIVATHMPASAAAGDPIVDNNYRVDMTHTVTSGSTRKIGMGGADVGLAEGNAMIPDNPAAVAYRARQFMRPWEFDMALGSVVTTDDDVDNSGSAGSINGERAMVDTGLMAQYKNFGIGGVAHATVVSSDDLPNGEETHLVSGTAAMGYTVFDHQLAFGASVNPVGARVKEPRYRDQTALKLKGLGWGAGVLWHPERGHWRFGAAYTSSVSTDEDLPQSTSPVTVGNLIVPNGVLTSGNMSFGLAYEWNQFSLCDLSRPAIGTFDVRIFDKSPGGANGGSAFTSQTYQPIGQKTVVSLHTGLEVEAVPHVLRLRVGTYREPSRYEGVNDRYHVTGGFEMRVTKFNVWDKRPLSISYAFDSAPRYQVHSVSIWVYTFTVPVP